MENSELPAELNGMDAFVEGDVNFNVDEKNRVVYKIEKLPNVTDESVKCKFIVETYNTCAAVKENANQEKYENNLKYCKDFLSKQS